jgi:carbon-monoxide dehydrogenase medium subunit
MKPARFEYERPRDLAEALAALTRCEGDARVIAGGQSLGPLLNLRVITPSLLVDISKISELTEISLSDYLVLGAGITHARIEDGVGGDGTAGLLPRVASGIAYRPVRNRGTIGGSLAHADPTGDWAPVMMALGATFDVRGSNGTRILKASGLISAPLTTVLAPDEIIVTIRIPRLRADARWGHVKFSRKPGDFADSLAATRCSWDPCHNSSPHVRDRAMFERQ